MTTGVVTLTDTYIHLEGEPATFLKVQAGSGNETTEGPERTDLMQGGNVQRATGKGAIHKFNVTLVDISTVNVQTLRSWIGAQLIFRDTRRRVWKGGIEGKSLDINEHGPTETADVSFVFVATETGYVLVEEE